jgi:hypothetical protein
MSALETAVRVNSEKQTLILAGESVPRQSALESLAGGRVLAYPDSRRPFTIVSISAGDRGNSYSAANAYARTQQLSGAILRRAIIDTYA